MKAGTEELKADFERLKQLRVKIKKALELEEMARDSATRMTSMITPTPKGKGNSSKVELYTVKALEAARLRAELEADYLILQLETTERIMSAIGDPLTCAVLIRRYVEGDCWQKIFDALDCSPRQCFRLHRKGLQALEGSSIREDA